MVVNCLNNILILGSTGMLGKMVSLVFSMYSKDNLYFTSRSEDKFSKELNGEILFFDPIKDNFADLCKIVNPNFVINCIGAIKPTITNKKESINNAISINSLFPLEISKTAVDLEFNYIQIGTDCVFSGSKGNYSELSMTDATDVYGKTKIVGEVTSANKALIRSSIVGPETGNGKSLLNWFLRTEDLEVNGFTDHEWNGVTTLNFAKIVLGITKNQNKNIKLQHLIPNDKVNKYELLLLFQEYFSKQIKINDAISEAKVDRTLKTNNSRTNDELWKLGGYQKIPSVRENISELAEFEGTKKILEFL
tara:strand:- start:311 stop:1231 length:921 start_codon:yes stop_codon:yes gene_type:complete